MTDAATKSDAGGFIALFIKRPILASVLSLMFVLAGMAAFFGVEVRELPDVDQPVVSVNARYPGAAPESMDAEVTAIIENAVALIDGVKSISSSSSYESSNVSIEFLPSVDINIAATDVKNAVSGVIGRLPDEVLEPSVVKADSDSSPIMRLAVAADAMEQGELGDLVDRIIAPRLQSVEGVAAIEQNGVRNRVIRIRINPAVIASRGISVSDIATIVRQSTRSAPSGTLKSVRQELLIRAEASAVTPEELGALRLNPDTRLSDVAAVEWDVQQDASRATVNGEVGVGLGVIRQAQSNTVEVAEGVRAAIKDLSSTLPSGVKITVTTDDSIFIKRAIEEVEVGLLSSVIIVVGVIYLFLRSARATIIPAFAIPISLIGTLAAMYLAGFSINILTLLALVMATGLVVDDAIVVVENISRWRAMGYGPRAAALHGTREILFAVIATTVTLVAVFVPISFLPGQAGRLFSEFGFVMAFAVLISTVVAVTLCPMLTAKFMAGAADHAQRKSGSIDRLGARGQALYARALEASLARPVLAFAVSIGFALGAMLIFAFIKKELTPSEDRGRLFMMIRVQQSANVDYVYEKVREVQTRLMPYVEKGEAERVITFAGFGGGGFAVMPLKDWSKRERSQQEIQAEVQPLVSSIPGVQVFVRGGNSLGIRGAGQGLQFAVAAEDYAAAADAAQAIVDKLQQNPLFTRVALNFDTSQPQLNIKIDREAAARLGVDASSVSTLVSAMADEYKAGEIFAGDRIVDVFLSAQGARVDDPQDLENLFVRTRSGEFIPLASIASIRESAVASRLGREERRRAVPVTASLAPGAALGDAVEAMRAAAKDTLPPRMSIILLGEAKLLQESTSNAGIVFLFAAIIVLLVLAAQFESVVSAAIIMSTVPFGLAAAVYAMLLTGTSFNYYSQIGLVLLIGIMAKNGILIVEFANQLRDRGLAVREAVREASMTRLRPVMMTALCSVLGGLPLILGSGAGAEARGALGWVIIGGLGFATVFTLFLTPAAYALLAGLSRPRAAEALAIDAELDEGRRRTQPAE
jgi:HAE1 family hydrophobic/amphiphilic exporter-1